LKDPIELKIAVDAGVVTALAYRAADRQAMSTLVLAHGAGAGQRSPFMVEFARALAARGVDVVTFNFPYTEQGRRLPDRKPVLELTYQRIVSAVRVEVDSARRALFIGGKSMGGRIATEIAAADPRLPVSGLVLLGYPLHPPGRPQQRRDQHLASIRRPMLVVQGSRDAFGTPDELAPILAALNPRATMHLVPGGDHSFKVARDAVKQASIHAAVQDAIVKWMRETGG
jgi:predicted alpha/beta-hydrolase family hydrolase